MKRLSQLFWIPFYLLPLAVLVPGCVSLEGMPGVTIPGAPNASASLTFPDLDAGSTSMSTIHFLVKGYNDTDMRAVSDMAESLYNKIGNDTGLYSYLASQNFTIVIYKDHDEYVGKTHQPPTTMAVYSSSAVYVYPDPDLEPALAFQLTRMVMNNYLADKASTLRWLVEGLATYEEVFKMKDSDRSAFQTSQTTQLRANHQSFSQMTFFVPATADTHRTDVWYQQVESVTAYLLNQGSALTFAAMMSELRSGSDIDHAIGDAYPAKFRNLNELETAWKFTI